MAAREAPLAVLGLNHITLAVSDVARSVAFYEGLLGFELRMVWEDGAYLEARAFWLCLSRDEAVRTAPHPDYTHIAFSVDAETFDRLAVQVASASQIWKQNKSEGKSLYFLDPDGHKLELQGGSLATRLAAYRIAQRSVGRFLTVDAARWGLSCRIGSMG